MTEQVRDIAIKDLVPSEFNPRRDPGNVAELAASIRESGVLEPIIVTPVAGNGHFAVIAGRRRWAASVEAGKTTVPAIVREMTDDEAEATSLIENLHREDLSPLEEAQGYARWLEIKGKAGEKVTHDDLAKAVGKARSSVTNALRLLDAPAAVKAALAKGQFSAAHARVAMSVPTDMLPALKITKGITVDELEDQAHDLQRAGAAVTELRGRIEDAVAKGSEVTWRKGEIWLENVRVDLSEILGKAPKAIAGILSDSIQLNSAPWSIRGSADKHDAVCTCRAYAPRANDGAELERVCISPSGWKKYRAALSKGAKTKSGAVKKKVISAAAKQAAIARELKQSLAEATKALDGKSLPSYHALKLDIEDRFLKGGLSAEPARLALFGFVADHAEARGKTWKVELWKLIAKMPLKDVRERVTKWAVAVGFQQIRESSTYGGYGSSKSGPGRNNSGVIRALVNEHYGAAKKPKKKSAR